MNKDVWMINNKQHTCYMILYIWFKDWHRIRLKRMCYAKKKWLLWFFQWN